MSDFKNIVEHAIETAKKLGAQNARVSSQYYNDLDISWRKSKIETMKSASEAALTLSLFVDGRYGAYQTSDLRLEFIDEFIAKCIKMTRLLEEDPARTLADPASYENRYTEDLDLFDDNIPNITPDNVVEYCKKLEDISKAHTEIPITDVTTEYEIEISESYMATTNGFSGSKKQTIAAGMTSMVVADGEKKPSDYSSTAVHHLADLHSPEELADECAKYCALRLGAKKLPSGKRTIIFDRRIARRMIINYLSPITGSALIMKSSYFMDKLGQKLASDLLDIYDDPLIPRGIGSNIFDSEGMSLHKMPVFEKGTLKQFYINTYAGNKLNMQPTTGNFSTLVLTPGKRSLNEMIADVKDGIYVTGILGGNQDRVRGDFSHGIIGVAIENGKLTTPVSEMNITGNHLDLWQRLVEVGNDFRTDTSHRIPSIRIDDVAVSGT